ncbi:hypothetical protein QRX25_08670 [Bacillus sp. L381]|uniref:hypothetical protein n=1 Tax=Bacillus TaxID=1386 RepID=UPI000E2797B3|nr:MULTISPECIES: hypothetical protein [Bacillus]MCR9038285.1 hypothetical protein [Bacillus velezensis]QUN11186.1 hypothetical protein KEF49_08555 [Bacillus amyloliquefaciens]QYM84313.1 hypothetical protein KTJ85_08670 [Bacillus sp. 7D3]QZY13498.1 hypothetical protein K7B13_08615 [Bacillus amyloliquefaciens]RDY88745.1 hypothetical protein C3733_08470 [Bacillus amyloliquefaciens]
MEGLNNSYNITKDPNFLAFCSLATEGAGISSNQQCSINFDEFKEALEKGKVVDHKNLKSSSELHHQFDYWKSRITGGQAVTETDNQVLDIIKQAYNLGMVTKDNMLLRNQAMNAYKTSI